MQGIIAKLLSNIKAIKDIIVPSKLTHESYIVTSLSLKERGATEGKNNRPASDQKTVDHVQSDTIRFVKGEFSRRYSSSIARLKAISLHFNNLVVQRDKSDVERCAAETVFTKFAKAKEHYVPQIEKIIRKERAHGRTLSLFKQKHNRTNVPSSPIHPIGTIAIIFAGALLISIIIMQVTGTEISLDTAQHSVKYFILSLLGLGISYLAGNVLGKGTGEIKRCSRRQWARTGTASMMNLAVLLWVLFTLAWNALLAMSLGNDDTYGSLLSAALNYSESVFSDPVQVLANDVVATVFFSGLVFCFLAYQFGLMNGDKYPGYWNVFGKWHYTHQDYNQVSDAYRKKLAKHLDEATRSIGEYTSANSAKIADLNSKRDEYETIYSSYVDELDKVKDALRRANSIYAQHNLQARTDGLKPPCLDLNLNINVYQPEPLDAISSLLEQHTKAIEYESKKADKVVQELILAYEQELEGIDRISAKIDGKQLSEIPRPGTKLSQIQISNLETI